MLIVALLATTPIAFSSGAARARESLSREQGLTIVRVVVSAEVELRASGNGWGDLSDVVRVGNMQRGEALPPAKIVDSSTATVLDYTLRLTRSDDKKHLQVSLTPTVTKLGDNRISWFSLDQTEWIIYTGQPIH
jgi:hypothetical protein